MKYLNSENLFVKFISFLTLIAFVPGIFYCNPGSTKDLHIGSNRIMFKNFLKYTLPEDIKNYFPEGKPMHIGISSRLKINKDQLYDQFRKSTGIFDFSVLSRGDIRRINTKYNAKENFRSVINKDAVFICLDGNRDRYEGMKIYTGYTLIIDSKKRSVVYAKRFPEVKILNNKNKIWLLIGAFCGVAAHAAVLFWYVYHPEKENIYGW